MGSAGNLPASVGKPADRNGSGYGHEISARIIRRHRTRSVRFVLTDVFARQDSFLDLGND